MGLGLSNGIWWPSGPRPYIPSCETKIFIIRVEADGGVVESPQCIDKALNRVLCPSTTAVFITRVIADSGIIESPGCISKALI